MINRIFKTVLVLTICLGLTIPTNAAVSVSDGSAFVTKAEFAADLNNLSNRMAHLENSLDAKIDSLVSSYLTRNGIWNGAKQELVSSKYRFDSLSLYGSEVTHNFETGYMNSDTTVTMLRKQFICLPIAKSEYSMDYTVVNSLNKSGFCTVEYVVAISSYWGQNSNYYANDNTQKWWNNQSGYEDLGKITDTFSIVNPIGCGVFIALDADFVDYSAAVAAASYTYVNGISFLTSSGSNITNKMFRSLVTAGSTSIGNGSVRNRIPGESFPLYTVSSNLNLILNPVIFFDSFFVAKGDSLILRLVDKWSGRMYTAYSIVAANATTTSHAYINKSIQINSVNVY